MRKIILVIPVLLAMAACGSTLQEQPGYSQAITCNAVAPLHQRLEVEVRAGKLDDHLVEVQVLNNRYRAVCAEGQPLPGQAAALLDDLAVILSGVK